MHLGHAKRLITGLVQPGEAQPSFAVVVVTGVHSSEEDTTVMMNHTHVKIGKRCNTTKETKKETVFLLVSNYGARAEGNSTLRSNASQFPKGRNKSQVEIRPAFVNAVVSLGDYRINEMLAGGPLCDD